MLNDSGTRVSWLEVANIVNDDDDDDELSSLFPQCQKEGQRSQSAHCATT